MRVLVTGSDGYIGCLLGPYLVERGHDVVGVDAGFYRTGWLYNGPGPLTRRTLTKDIRQIDEADLEGFDAVVHLAELSNDPLGQLAPHVTHEINHEGSVTSPRRQGGRRAALRLHVVVQRLRRRDERHRRRGVAAAPQTAYARCKELVERDVGALADERFSPVFLRNATAYGASPQDALRHRPQQPCRPRLDDPRDPHGERRDALASARPRPRHLPGRSPQFSRRRARRVHGQILNVGAPEANYQIREIADDRRPRLPGLRGDGRRARRRQAQLSRLVREDPRAPARFQLRAGSRASGRGSFSRCSRPSASRRKTSRREGSRG